MTAPRDPHLDNMLGRNATGPLSGIIVADFSRVLAGPYCTMLLADMGATVLKIEGPGGDDTRTWKPPVRDDQATYFLSVNRNKRSIALDFRDPQDLATAQALAARADVMVENFKPEGLAGFDLDYGSVAALNPSIIYASITGFGTGGGAKLPGYDLLVQAISGMMSLTGHPSGEPFRSGVAVFDVMTGLHASVGILAALAHRTATGEGQLIEVNLLSSALSGMVNQTAAYVTGGVVPQRMGNEHPSLYPYEPMETGEGELIIAIGNDAQFDRLCVALGVPALSADERFATMPRRNLNRDQLRILLQDRLSAHSAAEWFDTLTEVGLPCAPIQDVRGGINMATKLGLSPVAMTGTGSAAIPTVRNPIGFSRTPPSYDIPPPALNADAEMIRAWLHPATKPPRENGQP